MISMKDILQGDPDFSQKVTRLVFNEVISPMGRPIFTTQKSTIWAVVTTPNNNEMVRWVDSTTYSKAKCFTTTTILNPDTLATDPDELIYKGDYYVIVGIDDYDEFGYTRAYATMINYQQSRSNRK